MKNLIYLYFILLLSCEKDRSSFILENRNILLNIYTDKNEIKADGYETMKLYATLPSDVDKDSVNFILSNGIFKESGKNTYQLGLKDFGDSLRGFATIVSSLEAHEMVTILAEIEEFYDSDTVRFVKAYPDSMNIECNVPSILSGFNSMVVFNVQLSLMLGQPSVGLYVNYMAKTANENAEIGGFRSLPINGSDSTGRLSGIFDLRDTSYAGIINLIATMPVLKDTLRDTFELIIIK